MKKAVVAVLFTLVLLGTMSLVACGPTETRTDTFSVGSSPAAEVEVGNGNVSLGVGTVGEVIVTAELRNLDRIEYEVSRDGDSITVDAKTRSNSRANITVTVPAKTEFVLSTGNGDVSAVGVQATGRVNSGNGSITLEQVRGDVEVSVGNGDITLGDVEGSFILSDGNGSITLRDAMGSFIVSNGNGDIRFQGELTADSNNAFSVGNGSVTLELAGSPSLALDLKSDDGDVRVDLQVTVRDKAEGKLVGTVGNGEGVLKVRVGTGDITIK